MTTERKLQLLSMVMSWVYENYSCLEELYVWCKEMGMTDEEIQEIFDFDEEEIEDCASYCDYYNQNH